MASSNEWIPMVEDLSSSDSDDDYLLETTTDIEEMESRGEHIAGENDDLLSRLDLLSRSMTENALFDAEGDLDDLDSKLKRAKLCWRETTRQMKQECDDTRKNITRLQNLVMYANLMAMQIANQQARRDGQIAEMDRCLLDVGEELAQLIPEQRAIKQKNRELSQQLADLQRKMRKQQEERKRLKHQLDECNIFRLRILPDGDTDNVITKIKVSFPDRPQSDVKWSLENINDWLLRHQSEKNLAVENNRSLGQENDLLSKRLEQLTRENAELKADIEETEKCHELQLAQNMAGETILEDHGKQEVTPEDQAPADETVVRSTGSNQSVGKRKTAQKKCLKLFFNILTKSCMVICFLLMIILYLIVDGSCMIFGLFSVVILSLLLVLIIDSKLNKYFDTFYDLLSLVATTDLLGNLKATTQ